jgi:hypothetical protein
MQNPFQPNLRKPWALLCLTALVVYSILPVRGDSLTDIDAISFWLEALMFLLAFPLGDLLASLFYAGDGSIAARFTFWAIALAVGYVQWFSILPALLRRKRARVTTLNLATVGNVAFESGTTPQTASARPEPELSPLHDAPPVPQFNDRGMTPLEIILRDEN